LLVKLSVEVADEYRWIPRYEHSRRKSKKNDVCEANHVVMRNGSKKVPNLCTRH